jgi:hypothetical protein
LETAPALPAGQKAEYKKEVLGTTPPAAKKDAHDAAMAKPKAPLSWRSRLFSRKTG